MAQQNFNIPLGTGDSKQLLIRPEATAVLLAVEGDEVETLGTCPPRTKQVYCQHRACGDYYFDIEGDRHIAAIGATRAEACRNALTLAGGSLA